MQKSPSIITKNSFLKNVVTLMTGATVAQAIPILVSPILTRLFSPEEFGMFALYMSVVSIFSVAVTGRYELAILLPKEDKSANGLAVLIFVVSSTICCVALILLFYYKDIFLAQFGLEHLSSWIYLVPMSALLIGWSQALNYWTNRQSAYKRLAVSRVAQSSSSAMTNMGLGYTSFFNGGLIVGAIIGQLINVLVLGRLFLKLDAYKNVTVVGMLELAKRYINFPRIAMFSGLINMSAKELPKTMLGNFLGLEVLGFLSLAQRIMVIPVSMISSSTSSVFFKYASEEYKQTGHSIDIFDSTLKKLVLIAIVPMTIGFFVAPWLFAFVFGDKWRIAGEATQLLIPFYFFYFIGSPLNTMFAIAEKQSYEMAWQVIFFCLSVGSILMAKIIGLDFKSTILLFSICNACAFIISIFITRRIAKGVL